MKIILTIGLAAALATTMSIGFADNDDDDDDDNGFRNEYKHRVVNALEPSVDTKEQIVISLATSPLDVEVVNPRGELLEIDGDPEPACIALQIGANLLMEDLTEDGEPDVTAADSVTLFATLDGVELVANDLGELKCLTKDGYKLLSDVLNGFVSKGGEIVVCPLCWGERGHSGTAPTIGSVADAFDIHELFLTTDKVLSF